MDTTFALGIGFSCIAFLGLGFFTLLFGTLVLVRWFRYRENLALIERGLTPADMTKARNGNGKGLLAWGIAIIAFGLALMCGLASFSGLPMLYAGDPTGIMFPIVVMFAMPGLLVLSIGIALVIIYYVTRPEPAAADLEAPPPPAALEAPTPEESPGE